MFITSETFNTGKFSTCVQQHFGYLLMSQSFLLRLYNFFMIEILLKFIQFKYVE